MNPYKFGQLGPGTKRTGGKIELQVATHSGYRQAVAGNLAGKPNRSSLVQDFPVNFFWGSQKLKAGIIIPNEEIQTRLIELIEKGDNAKLHNPNYSVIANPMNSQLQNCTEHTLDLINAAIYQTTNISYLKSINNCKNFKYGNTVLLDFFSIQ